MCVRLAKDARDGLGGRGGKGKECFFGRVEGLPKHDLLGTVPKTDLEFSTISVILNSVPVVNFVLDHSRS